jgi:hypothetical protein
VGGCDLPINVAASTPFGWAWRPAMIMKSQTARPPPGGPLP